MTTCFALMRPISSEVALAAMLKGIFSPLKRASFLATIRNSIAVIGRLSKRAVFPFLVYFVYVSTVITDF